MTRAESKGGGETGVVGRQKKGNSRPRRKILKVTADGGGGWGEGRTLSRRREGLKRISHWLGGPITTFILDGKLGRTRGSGSGWVFVRGERKRFGGRKKKKELTQKEGEIYSGSMRAFCQEGGRKQFQGWSLLYSTVGETGRLRTGTEEKECHRRGQR